VPETCADAIPNGLIAATTSDPPAIVAAATIVAMDILIYDLSRVRNGFPKLCRMIVDEGKGQGKAKVRIR